MQLDNSAQIFNTLSDIPGDITVADQLLEVFDSFKFYRVLYLSLIRGLSERGKKGIFPCSSNGVIISLDTKRFDLVAAKREMRRIIVIIIIIVI